VTCLQAGASPFSSPNFTPSFEAPSAQGLSAYWLLFQGDRLVVRVKGKRFALPKAPRFKELGLGPVNHRPTDLHYLGYLSLDEGQIHCYVGDLDGEQQLPEDYEVKGLRSLFARMDEVELALAGRAIQIINWERTHRFCGRCGSPTETVTGERSKRCPKCGLSNYPRLSPAIIIAITKQTEDGPRILLARNHRFPSGRYSVIAGFVEPGESLEECAHREVAEEVGLRIRNLRYFGSQPWPFPNSLMVAFIAEYAEGEIVPEVGEIADARWFAPDDLPQVPPRASIARRLIDWFAAEHGVPLESVEDWRMDDMVKG
jgi:NAD+ diphosphatase